MQKKFKSNKLLVSETFVSLQGEGPYQGYPCFFIRLSGCPHNCIYCDTEYAKFEGEEKTFEELLNLAKESNLNLIEITGGEPLFQDATPLFLELLLEKKFKVLLESSGFELLKDVPEKVIKIIDFKTPKSGNANFNLENLKYLKKWDALKFVILDKEDFFWAKEKIENLKLNKKCKIYFSPAHPIMPPLILANLILKYKLPVFLNLQIHKLIWGQMRAR